MEKEKKRRSWFERIRRLFTSSSAEPKQKPNKPPEKRGKSKRWLPGKLRTQTSFALPAPAPPEPEPAAAAGDQISIRQAEDEQNKHAMAVAVATAVAAEAAVAAAHAAAEVVRLTGSSNHHQTSPPPPLVHEHEQAAVAIQSAYRGYLARRALRALKGLVRLQALIRGQAVRRQTAATLRGLESLMKIQARHRGRPLTSEDDYADDDLLFLRRGGGRDLYAAAGHEEQQQGPQYASIQNEKLGIRRPPMSRDELMDQRWSWLEEWVGSHHQPHQQPPPPFDKDIPVAHQSPYRHADAADRLGCSARRSFVRPRRTPPRAAGDSFRYDDSAAFPGYMASTASAKAKFRSMSTPKERSAASSDAYSEHCFPFADRMLSPIPSMSPIPSIASDMGFARSARPPVAQRSPRVVKGPMTPARSRSRRSPSHHSFGSEAALHQLQMEQYTPVR